MASKDPNPGLMHALGSFFGHLWHGIRTDPAKPERRIVKTETQLETRDTPQGRVVLRRTTIEEVELPTPSVPKPDAPPRR